MAKKHAVEYATNEYVNPNKVVGDAGYGGFMKLSKSLVRFLGPTNAIFLTNLTEYYNYLRKNEKIKRQSYLFFSRNHFEQTYGISLYNQRKAIAELSAVGLVKEERRTYNNQSFIYLNTTAIAVFMRFATDADLLPQRWKVIQQDKKLQKRIRKWLKKNEQKCIRAINNPDNDGDDILGDLMCKVVKYTDQKLSEK